MKTTLKLTLCSFAALLTACSSNDAPKMQQPVMGEQVLILKVSNIQSRAGRELLSSEASQAIDNVTVLLTNSDGKVEWKKTIDNWTPTDASITMGSEEVENGREATIEIPKEEFKMMGGETFHAYAFGYSNGSDFDLTPITSINVGDQFNESLKITLNQGVGEELFAGDCTIVGDVDGVRAEVVLNRQVAGSFGYLTKIPYVRDGAGNVGTYLLLSASNPHKSLVFGCNDNLNIASPLSGMSVVNGVDEGATNVVYSINLKDWFSEIKPALDEVGRSNGLILVTDNWIGDSEKYRVGSVFGGSFIVPFEKVESPSFKLLLCYDNDPSTVMRTWIVNLPSTAAQLTDYDLWQFGEKDWNKTAVKDEISTYNVLRNRLYGIGVKGSAVLPFDPSNPDDDDPTDQPEPINNKQDLTIIVNHNWDAIYHMEVE